LKTIVPPTQIVFGTDFPWGTPAQIAAGLVGCGFTDAELAGVDRENALRLLPQFRT
jgi:predicted TIM-barrel fold metal-dependent hydrolase